MIPKSRLPDTEPDEIPQELTELGRKILAATGPQRDELCDAYRQVVDAVRRRRHILNLVQEALAQLRLDIKYMMFDLEATRQERDELKKQIEDR